METRALIELLDRSGAVQHAVRVRTLPFTIGRDIGCDLVLDDPHVAALHLRLVEAEDGRGALLLEPLPSLNGARLGDQLLVPGHALPVQDGASLGLGLTRLRVRLAGAPLAPERPLAPADPSETAPSGRRVTGALGLAAFAAAGTVFQQWLGADPGTPLTEMLGVFMAVPVALAIWCGLWATASKLFQQRFAFWAHAHVALQLGVASVLTDALGQILAFALSAPWLAHVAHLASIALMIRLVWRHLAIVLPQRRHMLGWTVGAMAVTALALNIAGRVREEQPLVGNLYVATLPPPSFRLVSPSGVDAFVDRAASLQAPLNRWAKDSGDNDSGSDEDE